MYTNFYNLKEKPFSLTSSPRFLYLGESHKKALDLLTNGVAERKGLILLTGEVGTGKTTMIQALLSNLDNTVRPLYLSNPVLSPRDFMDYLAFSAFRKKIHFKSKADFVLEFKEFLWQCLQHQQTCILIIDEGQKLSFELLEEIRLLSEMESGDETLINIFLVGQPELLEVLSEQQCRLLLGRIEYRYHIPPLDLTATKAYMTTRLQIAGAKTEKSIFSNNAITAIHRYSSGYPRMINILADNCLLLGFSRAKSTVTARMVKECYEDLNLENIILPTSQKAPEPHKIKQAKSIHAGRYWKWVAVFCFVALIAAALLRFNGWNVLGHRSEVAPVSHQPSSAKTPAEQTMVREEGSADKNHVSQEPLYPAEPDETKTLAGEILQRDEPLERAGPLRDTNRGLLRHITVKKGDTLAGLATAVYGRSDKAILQLIQQYNPEIKDINMIQAGQELAFPPVKVLSD